eukprot:1907097-Prymnesium_polylepis.1
MGAATPVILSGSVSDNQKWVHVTMANKYVEDVELHTDDMIGAAVQTIDNLTYLEVTHIGLGLPEVVAWCNPYMMVNRFDTLNVFTSALSPEQSKLLMLHLFAVNLASEGLSTDNTLVLNLQDKAYQLSAAYFTTSELSALGATLATRESGGSGGSDELPSGVVEQLAKLGRENEALKRQLEGNRLAEAVDSGEVTQEVLDGLWDLTIQNFIAVLQAREQKDKDPNIQDAFKAAVAELSDDATPPQIDQLQQLMRALLYEAIDEEGKERLGKGRLGTSAE